MIHSTYCATIVYNQLCHNGIICHSAILIQIRCYWNICSDVSANRPYLSGGLYRLFLPHHSFRICILSTYAKPGKLRFSLNNLWTTFTSNMFTDRNTVHLVYCCDEKARAASAHSFTL